MVTDCADGYVPATGEKTGVAAAMPVPLSETVNGVLLALSTTESWPAAPPTEPGVNTIETVQLPVRAGRAKPPVQVVPLGEMVKPLLPGRLMLVSVNGAESVLVSVVLMLAEGVPTAVLGNVRLLGLKASTTPVPLRATVCVAPADPPELSVMVRVELSKPVAVGVKITPM